MSEPRKITCLHRLGDKQLNQVINLEDQTKVTLGRAETNDVVLGESLAVSRNHVLLEKEETADKRLLWTLTDLNSGNGVFLNDRKIAPRVPHPLQNRDLIEIGRDARCDQVAPYRFRYYVKAIILVKEEKKEAEAPALCTCEAAPSPMTHMKMKLSEQEQRLKSEFSAKQKEFEDKLEELQKLVLEKEKENNLNQDNAVKSEGDKDQQEDQTLCTRESSINDTLVFESPSQPPSSQQNSRKRRPRAELHSKKPKRRKSSKGGLSEKSLVGKRINHLWILDSSTSPPKSAWYSGQIVNLLAGTDGCEGSVYEVKYDEEDYTYTVDHVIEDLKEGSLKLL